jgi:VIT1/CCC1 family predicted Fe2+/Mn2+ transporter
MLKTWQFWTLTAIASLAVICVAANMVLFIGNRAAQAEVAGRQDYIQKSVQFEALYREIVKALADLSIRNQDEELRNLLAARGISVTLPPPAAPAASSPRK